MIVKVVRRRIQQNISLIFALLVAIVLKIWLLLAGAIQMNSDEAIVALMAKHILQGERPLFFYGQSYMGSLDAALVASGFFLFGQHVWVVRMVQIILYVITLINTYFLGKEIYQSSSVGKTAVWLLAIPTVNMTLYTTVSLGGYGEALMLGNLILLNSLRIVNAWREERFERLSTWAFLFGLLTGFGFWVFGLTLVYTIPSLFYIVCFLVRYIRRLDNTYFYKMKAIRLVVWMILGWFLGSLPWLVYAFQHGFRDLFNELSGSAIATVENQTGLVKTINHIFNFIVFGVPVIIGLRPPWDVYWLALPLAPMVLTFWFLVVIAVFKVPSRMFNELYTQMLLIGVICSVIVGFIVTPFGADPSGRYFLPVELMLAKLGASFINKMHSWKKFGVLGLLITYHLCGTIQCAVNYPPGFTTQFDPVTRINHDFDKELIDFLIATNEKYGYTNYWVAYPLAFHSDERVIFVPHLPYHLDFRYTNRDDRYKKYTDMVNQSTKVAYITTNHPDLDHYLQQKFLSLGFRWKEKIIGDYHVFYELSSVVRPDEIGLGSDWIGK